MHKRFSALESGDNFNFKNKNKSKLNLIEIPNLQLLQVATWPDSISEVGLEISKSLNLNNYAFANKVVTNKSIAMMRIEPTKWWILNSEISNFEIENATILDLSHAFTHIEISGLNSKIFLNRYLPIDFREQSFPFNSIASSAIHHVSVKLWYSKNGYQLFIPRGFANSLWDLFLETAEQFIYDIN